MNKNVKRIIAMAVAIGTISAVAPATSSNLLTTRAFAATTNTYDNLDSLKLTSSSGSNIKLYSDNGYDSSDKVDDDEVSPDDVYYAKTPSDTINVEIDGPSTKYVRVFKGTSSSTKGKKVSSDISISDTTTIVIKVYGEEPDTDVRYDDDDDLLNTYKVKVKYTGSDSSDSSDSTADDYDEIYLDKITVDGDSINLSESEINYTYNVASDIDEVTIKAVPEDEDEDTVEIDGNDVDSSDKYKQTVSLDKGENKIEIKVTNEDDDERVYTLKINRGTSTSTSTSTTSSTTADDYDSIYLDKISVDGTSVELSKSKINYSYNVASDVNEVIIKATPEDEDEDTVEIDGDEVDSDDKYKKTVSLVKGENKIKIELTNQDDEERVYTLNITRGTSTSSGTTTTAATSPSTATEVTTPKVNQWVKNNGIWKYNDSTGNALKNSWILSYYVGANGDMATEWLKIDGNWYYFGSDGARKTGWQLVNGVWYYLDSAEGKMKIGWMKDTNGKYYYLNSDGTMASNTTIAGYKLGRDGAWIR